MRSSFGFVGLVVVVAVLGAATAKPMVLWVARHLSIHDGPWITLAGTGTDRANPYARAAVALAGLYALQPREAVYYTALTDSDGHRLQGQCEYRVEGTALPAQWWSITLYGADNYLVDNPDKRYSWNGQTLGARPGRGFEIHVSAHRQSGHWLPAPAAGPFSLTLRLYRPRERVLENPATVKLPDIQREHCA